METARYISTKANKSINTVLLEGLRIEQSGETVHGAVRVADMQEYGGFLPASIDKIKLFWVII